MKNVFGKLKRKISNSTAHSFGADRSGPDADSDNNNRAVSGNYNDDNNNNPFDDDDGNAQSSKYLEEIEVSETGKVAVHQSESVRSGVVHGHLAEEEAGGNADLDNEDLDFMLESLDIDKDFQLFSSFRNSMNIRSSTKSGKSSSKGNKSVQPSVSEEEENLETETIQEWSKRLEREEVFSHRYHPSKEENQELKEIEKALHMNRLLSNLGKHSAADEDVWKRLVHPDPKSTTPASIILKRGPILYKSSAHSEQKEHEAELVVFTHGFVIATIVNSGKTVTRNFERAMEYTSVVRVAPDSVDESAWEAIIRSPRGQERLTFISGSHRQQGAWLHAMEVVLVNHFMHDKAHPKDMGWQYRIVHKPAFTMAVLGVEDDLEIPGKEYLRQLDKYKGYPPLHYAVRLKHVDIVRSLLEEGADPNLSDEEGFSAVYHAVHDQASEDILDLLENFGANDIDKVVSERDELFERVTATNSEREVRREKEQQKQALAAQAKMSENMRLLHERGQKIDDASDKARQMNENAREYGNLAAQLKAKTKKQASWNPFS